MLSLDPGRRPSAREAMQHPFFGDVADRVARLVRAPASLALGLREREVRHSVAVRSTAVLTLFHVC
jgi:hypothetical protein